MYQVSCSSMDCTSSVAGPTRPNMLDSCCSQFQPGVCDSPANQTLPPMAEKECQRKCRTEKDCRFYSTSTDACILHSSCPSQRNPCQGCRSGPKRPPLEKLPENCGDEVTTTATDTTDTTAPPTASVSSTVPSTATTETATPAPLHCGCNNVTGTL